jgi:hypothetical protein
MTKTDISDYSWIALAGLSIVVTFVVAASPCRACVIKRRRPQLISVLGRPK